MTSRELCNVPGCNRYASVFRLVRVADERSYVPYCAEHGHGRVSKQERLP